MAATKNLRTIIAAGTTNFAAGTTTGAAVNLTAAYGGLLTAKLTNTASPPTIAASVYVYTSGDNTNFKLLYTQPGNVAASTISEFSFEIPPGVMYLRVDVKDNTNQSVTCEAFFQELTTI